MSDSVIVPTKPSALTFSVQDVVSWEHDATAHDVAFEAPGTESVSNPTAMKDLPIICERGGVRRKHSVAQLLVQLLSNKSRVSASYISRHAKPFNTTECNR